METTREVETGVKTLAMYQREAIVEPHPESAIPSILYEAHRKLWDSDISGSEEVLLDWLETNTDEIENIWVVSALTEVTS